MFYRDAQILLESCSEYERTEVKLMWYIFLSNEGKLIKGEFVNFFIEREVRRITGCNDAAKEVSNEFYKNDSSAWNNLPDHVTIKCRKGVFHLSKSKIEEGATLVP